MIIGSGNYGRVYRVTTNEKSSAIKVCNYDSDEQEAGIMASFLREVDVMTSCDHENIMHIKSFFFNNGIHYIVMPEGRLDLHTAVVENFSFDRERVLKGVASGLYYLEQKNILHCDFKPENIILYTRNNKVTPKISDFGIVSREVAVGKIVFPTGSWPWRSPEDLSFSKKRDFRSISWIFGMLIAFVLGNRRIVTIKSIKEYCELVGSPTQRSSLFEKVCQRGNIIPEYNYKRSMIAPLYDFIVKNCVVWKMRDRLSMYNICRSFNIRIEKPLTREEILQRSSEKFTVNKEDYKKMCGWMKKLYSQKDNYHRKHLAPLALSIFCRIQKPADYYTFLACVSIASKVRNSSQYYCLYDKLDKEDYHKVVEQEAEILEILEGRFTVPTSLSYYEIVIENNTSTKKVVKISNLVDEILKGNVCDLQAIAIK